LPENNTFAPNYK